MNKVFVVGRLTKDPEPRVTQSQTAVANFAIAVDRKVKREGGQEVDFFDCVAWGKTAEFMEKYWKKGMKAAISGRLENEAWTGKDGVKRAKTKIVVEEIDFCEKRQADAPKAEPEDFESVPEGGDELPFRF